MHMQSTREKVAKLLSKLDVAVGVVEVCHEFLHRMDQYHVPAAASGTGPDLAVELDTVIPCEQMRNTPGAFGGSAPAGAGGDGDGDFGGVTSLSAPQLPPTGCATTSGELAPSHDHLATWLASFGAAPRRIGSGRESSDVGEPSAENQERADHDPDVTAGTSSGALATPAAAAEQSRHPHCPERCPRLAERLAGSIVRLTVEALSCVWATVSGICKLLEGLKPDDQQLRADAICRVHRCVPRLGCAPRILCLAVLGSRSQPDIDAAAAGLSRCQHACGRVSAMARERSI